MANKIDAELTRIRETLARALEENRYSVRAVERKLGATVGAKRKALKGQIPLTVRHLLEMLEAIGLPWETFFQALYPPPGTKAPPLEVGTRFEGKEPEKARPETLPEEKATPAPEETEHQRAERIVRQVLAKVLEELLRGGKD